MPTYAAGHEEAGVGIDGFPLPTEALRYGTEHCRQIQHVIVEGEIADGKQIDPGLVLQQPMVAAQITADLKQLRQVEFLFPVGFKGFFQFSSRTDAGKSQGVGQHGQLLFWLKTAKALTAQKRKTHSPKGEWVQERVTIHSGTAGACHARGTALLLGTRVARCCQARGQGVFWLPALFPCPGLPGPKEVQ